MPKIKVKVKIKKSPSGHYWSFSENAAYSNTNGSTIDEVKLSIFSSIERQKVLGNFPYKNYEVIFIDP